MEELPKLLRKYLRKQPQLLILFLVIILIIIISTVITSSTANKNTRSNIALGAWVEGFWNNTDKSLHPEKMHQLENTLEKKLAIAHYYRGWHELEDPKVIEELNTITANEWTPLLSVNPYFFDGCVANGLTLYKAIAEGNCDQFLTKAAANLRQFDKPFFLRFAWETNIPTVEWSLVKTGSTPEEYQAAWIKVHTILAFENPNIKWVFCPNVNDGTMPSYINYYPGDTYVDWLCLDGYNWGDTQPWSKWQSFNDVFKNSYEELSAISPMKPMMIGEVNSAATPGNKSEWFMDMLSVLPKEYPQVKALIIFDENRTDEEHIDWSFASSPDALEAFKTGIKSPNYKSKIGL